MGLTTEGCSTYPKGLTTEGCSTYPKGLTTEGCSTYPKGLTTEGCSTSSSPKGVLSCCSLLQQPKASLFQVPWLFLNGVPYPLGLTTFGCVEGRSPCLRYPHLLGGG